MAIQLKQTEMTQAGSTSSSAEHADVGSNRADLRGMSYAEGAAALRPDNVQLKPDSSVQLRKDKGKDKDNDEDRDKKKDKKKKKDKGDLPDDIKALNLKRVKVVCPLSVWNKLDPETEQPNVLIYLQAREDACNSKANTIRRCTIVIKAEKLLEMTPEEVESLDQDAAANNNRMAGGRGPNTQSEEAGNETVIGVNKGAPKVTVIPIKNVTEVPILEPAEIDTVFGAEGSTFDSADYETSDMQQSGVMELLEQLAAEIDRILQIDPEAKITVTAIASESHVPNPPAFKVIGSLAQARADNAITLASTHLAGLDAANVTYKTQNLGANGPEWDRKLGAHNDCYTQHQFVKLQLHAEAQVDSGKTEPQVDYDTEEETSYDPEIITISQVDTKSGGGGDDIGKRLEKRNKKKKHKKSGKRQKWKPIEYVTTACHYK